MASGAAAAPARLAASCWTAAEAGVFHTLNSIAPVCITGGWVRDKLLDVEVLNPNAARALARARQFAGRPHGDMDVLLEGTTVRDFHARWQQRRGSDRGGGSRGFLVPAKGGRSLDVLKLRLHGLELDITSLVDASALRAKADSCRDPSAEAVGSQTSPTDVSSADVASQLRRDAGHRDVSFNALYYRPATLEVLDPSSLGLADLRTGVVRMPHPNGAAASISEDPLRLLRALRFASRLGLELEPALERACPALEEADEVRELFQRVSVGRWLDEFKKALLLHNNPHGWLSALGKTGAAEALGAHVFNDGALSGLLRDEEELAAAAQRVGRLQDLIWAGLEARLLTTKSILWRGRKEHEGLPTLLRPGVELPDVRESDWAELLLAALLWPTARNAAPLRPALAALQISSGMARNVATLQELAKSTNVTEQPLGVRLLRSSALATDAPIDFWRGTYCGKPRTS
eukprot:TRINITY_DN63316_c0_g1_i1.p1 TRINITY_DN63316_c0_g1~~TRINITY_DN63316_c0_g1_i1.p1  ORF type:complete len:462 (-),score=105.21 TRINITY_DN63316_c0_g1_i1:29-1414(-)